MPSLFVAPNRATGLFVPASPRSDSGYRTLITSRSSLISYWRLDAVSGTTETDQSGNGWTATVNGGVTLDQIGALSDGDSAELFDGASGTYVETNAVFNAAIGTGPLSVECWFKTSSALAQIGMIDDKDAGGNQAGFNVVMFAGVMFFRVADGVGQESIQTAPTYNDGNWHHFVGVLTRGAPDTINIYIDGVFVVSANMTTSGRNLTQSAHKLRIGSYTNAGSPNSFIGTLDDVAIYSSALTAAQVAADYRVGLGGVGIWGPNV